MKVLRFVSVTIAAGALLLTASAALAQDEEEVDRECIVACHEAKRDCVFDIREAAAACLDEAGCADLRAEFRETCLDAERDDEACSALRQAIRECVAPCHDAAHADKLDCREAASLCLSEECGIDESSRPRPHRPHRHPHRGR